MSKSTLRFEFWHDNGIQDFYEVYDVSLLERLKVAFAVLAKPTVKLLLRGELVIKKGDITYKQGEKL